MFCTESCEHGCNAPTSGKLISGNGAPSQTQQLGQQQFSMCYAPLSMQPQELGAKCETEPPRVGMCLVTEGPEGLSIDCNVPLPNSFNLDEYRKQMVCSCGPSVNGNGYIDGFCLPPPPATAALNSIQNPACSFQCQCCPVEAASSSGFDTRSMQATTAPVLGACSLPSLPARTSRPEQTMTVTQKAPESAVGQQIFYLAAPSSSTLDTEGSCYPPDQLPAYLYSMIPVQCMSPIWSPQGISLVPVGLPVPQPQLLPQQQLVTNPVQNSQLPSQQMVRYDISLPRLLAELRQERGRPCCESSTPAPLSFQLYAPAHAVAIYDPPVAAVNPSVVKRDVPAATPSPDAMSIPTASLSPSSSPPGPSPSAPDPTRSAKAQSDNPKCSRSCQRSKDQWDSSGAGNVCMKCGNCWHCPRCSCSNCFWHPGLVRAPPRDSR
ncbi:helicase SRCAP [Drosophila serrata]|uniref:helicase SRCAP n=1 Tax=Drosophila serrata TaxID=7274 RepID=UPI000A1D1CB3|nr:helicase SRCAP [Drosophila serrata]